MKLEEVREIKEWITDSYKHRTDMDVREIKHFLETKYGINYQDYIASAKRYNNIDVPKKPKASKFKQKCIY